MNEQFKIQLEKHKKKFESFNETEIEKAPNLITQIHVLDGCNLRCKHCYVGDRRFKPGPPLSLEEVVRRVQILKDFQVRHGFKGHTMNISGGEPTIHPKILEIIREIRKRDIKPFLLTNGMKISKILWYLSNNLHNPSMLKSYKSTFSVFVPLILSRAQTVQTGNAVKRGQVIVVCVRSDY